MPNGNTVTIGGAMPTEWIDKLRNGLSNDPENPISNTDLIKRGLKALARENDIEIVAMIAVDGLGVPEDKMDALRTWAKTNGVTLPDSI